jgi:hypothetical protein
LSDSDLTCRKRKRITNYENVEIAINQKLKEKVIILESRIRLKVLVEENI